MAVRLLTLERITEGGAVRYSGSFREEQSVEESAKCGERELERKRRLGQEGSEKKKGCGCSFFSVHDGKCRAEQSSWRRLNKSHYKLASAGCTKLTNSLYIKTNRPSRFLFSSAPADPGTAINFRNGFSCSLQRRLERHSAWLTRKWTVAGVAVLANGHPGGGRERYNYLIEFIRPTLVDLSRDDRFNPPQRRDDTIPLRQIPGLYLFFLFFFFPFLPFVLPPFSQSIHNQFKKWRFVTRN